MSRVSDLASSTRRSPPCSGSRNYFINMKPKLERAAGLRITPGFIGTQRLVNLETQTTQLDNYISNNKITKTRLKVASAAVTSIDKTISDFRDLLLDFRNSGKSKEEVAEIQKQAFQALTAIGISSIPMDGMYLFPDPLSTPNPSICNSVPRRISEAP